MGYPVDQFGRPINPDLSSEVNSSPTNDPVDIRSAEDSGHVGRIATGAYGGIMEVGPQENGAVRGEHILGDIVRSGEQNQPPIPGSKEQGVSLNQSLLLELEAPTGNRADEEVMAPEKTSGKILDFPGKKIEKEFAENPEAAYAAARDDAAEYVRKLQEQGKAA